MSRSNPAIGNLRSSSGSPSALGRVSRVRGWARSCLANAIENLECRRLLSAVAYDQTITTGAIAEPGSDIHTSKGGFFGAGQGIDDGSAPVGSDGQSYGGVIPASHNVATMKFTVTAAQKAAILADPTGVANFTLDAARDIGQRQTAVGVWQTPGTDFVTATGTPDTGPGITFGDLFKSYPSSVGPGEHDGTTPFTGEPNYHTDRSVTDSSLRNDFAITQAQLLSLIRSDNTIRITLKTTADVGRLKVFSGKLTFSDRGVDDFATTEAETPVVISAVDNDIDGSNVFTRDIESVSALSPSVGTVQIFEESFVTKLRFTPAPGFSGDAVFTYTARSPHSVAGSSTYTATVTVHVNPPPPSTYLSDLTPTFASNGFGPYEKDRSNGQDLPGDGHAITLNGTAYDKGLGVHGNSELRYHLAGHYTRFKTTIGVDDEVGNAGKVVFRVVADGVTLYESPAVTGASAPIPLDLNVIGKNELRLIVTTSDNGPNNDHADWGNARLTPEAGPVYVSDLVPTSASNGYGLFERDRSNGESGAFDGHTIKLGGVVYAKGLGVHAASDIRYNLAGQYDTFTSVIGVDDEVGAFGSVIFRVYGDGVLLYDSGVVTGTTPARPISVGVGGRQQLQLVVTNAGNGNAYDHADWADAKLYVTPPPTSSAYLSDVAPISAVNGFGPFENDHSNGGAGAHDGTLITLNGNYYTKGLGTHANSTLRYNLAGKYTQFAADVGIDDEVGNAGRVVFRVYGDGTLLFDSGVMTGATATKQARVNVAGRNELTLQVLDGGDGINSDHADWANAHIA